MKNDALDLAWKFITYTNKTIFLTGKAGTGKTTFLHQLKTHSKKRMVVVAPTGVAAINAGGVTIHSFFQLPFGPILPYSITNQSSRFIRKFNKTKINLIKSLDLLIIDEISMVRADVLDGIDATLKRYKNRSLPFGGVQVLMIGDLEQLSPVIKEDDWRLLQPYYASIYFFDSKVFQSCNALTIELKHIYRQDNPTFIKILNEVRTNTLSRTSIATLNKRYIPNFKANESEGYVSLTTHNYKADQVNQQELKALKTKSLVYRAKIEGQFPEHMYPNNETMALKIGAQVMFVKNDSGEDRLYFNGKIGKITALFDKELLVKCPDHDNDITVTPVRWENIKYTIDDTTKAIKEDVIGSYTQMPLRLAWSITIHKSQGLTFEKAIIDANKAFAHGQTYVALSRCKSLEGLVLKSKISSVQIIKDEKVIQFNKNAQANTPNETLLFESQKQHQLDTIFELFNFFEFLHPANRILDIYYKNRTVIEGNIETTMANIKISVTELLKVNTTFSKQLQHTADSKELPEDNAHIQERFTKAISYFKKELNTHILPQIDSFSFSTDNTTVSKEIDKYFAVLQELCAAKTLYFNSFETGFNSLKFLDTRAKAVFLNKTKPKKTTKISAKSTTNKGLFDVLNAFRKQTAEENNIPVYQVFTQKTLFAICELLPKTKDALTSIHGMGKVRIKNYGDAILNLVSTYCQQNEITPNTDNLISIDAVPKQTKGASKALSLHFFKDEGKTIEAIANERGLHPNTIFDHLASFIGTGDILPTELISEDHFTTLKDIVPQKTFQGLSDLKAQLNDAYSYQELRVVVNYLDKK